MLKLREQSEFGVEQSNNTSQNVYEDLQITDKMTICIAAIAQENGKEYAVIAADTQGLNSVNGLRVGAFNNRKFKFLNDKCVVMFTGRISNISDITSGFEEGMSYLECVNKIYKNYMALKDRKRDEAVRSRGLNETETYSFLLEIVAVVVGVDWDGKVQITHISDDGVNKMESKDFYCLGVGRNLCCSVILHKSEQTRNCSVQETVYNVFRAKKYAEASPDIGKETDMVVFSKDSYKELSKKDFDVLEKVFKEELEHGKNHKDLDEITF